jgi:hypothetical protein
MVLTPIGDPAPSIRRSPVHIRRVAIACSSTATRYFYRVETIAEVFAMPGRSG